MFEVDVTVALISLFGTIITAGAGSYVALRQKQRINEVEESAELSKSVVQFFRSFLGEWNDVLSEIKEIQNETSIDRFLLLHAFNGSQRPEFATAFLQIRNKGQKVYHYRRYRLDDHYRNILGNIRGGGFQKLKVSDMPSDSGLRAIYENEKVTEALVYEIERVEGDNGKSSIIYCSFATHSTEPISKNTVTRCTMLIDHIRHAANSKEASDTVIINEKQN